MKNKILFTVLGLSIPATAQIVAVVQNDYLIDGRGNGGTPPPAITCDPALSLTRAQLETKISNGDPLENLNVSCIKDFSRLFVGDYRTPINIDLSKWDVSSGENFSQMFAAAGDGSGNDTVGDLKNWNLISAKTLNDMFYGSYVYAGDLGKWRTPNATNMSYMFAYSTIFYNPITAPDLSDWEVGNVTDMSGMFKDLSQFNSDISKWDVSKVTDFSQMFISAATFNSDIGNWDVSSGEKFDFMMAETHAFTHDLSSWDVSNATSWNYFNDGSYNPIPTSKLPVKFR